MELTYDKLIEFDLVEERERAEDNVQHILEFYDLISEIKSTDQFIKDTPSYPGSTDKIIRNEMVSVVGATLSIEGTVLGKEEIEESFRKADRRELLQRKEQEAQNSRNVYTFILHLVHDNRDNFAYSEQMIKKIHKYFTENMDYLSNTPGEYRSNFISTFGEPRKPSLCKTQSEIEKAMSKFIDWLNRPGPGMMSQFAITKAIMAHYYLTEIHPFGDGNGRTARALEALILYLNGKNEYCFWSLANFWSFNKDKYIIHLNDIRLTGNPLDFLKWGIEGYLNEIKNIKNKVLKKIKQLMFMDYTRYLLNNKKNEPIKINQRIIDVINLLISIGRISLVKFQSSPEMIALYRNVTSSTRWRDFNKMMDADLVIIKPVDKEVFIEPNFSILDTISYLIK